MAGRHCIWRHERILMRRREVLLNNGALVNAKNREGRTPLYFAAMTDAHKTAGLLLCPQALSLEAVRVAQGRF